jgi:chemotaxis protein MotB
MDQAMRTKRISPGRLRPWADLGSSRDEEEQNWLITLSDLMSLLLVFFIIFVALSRVPFSEKGKGSIPVQGGSATQAEGESEPQALGREMRAVVASLGLGDQVSIRADVREVVITLKEAVTFPSGEDRILPPSLPILDALAGMIKRYPSYEVEIAGHTDDRPIHNGRFHSNGELSVARAASVLRYLMDGHALDPGRFTIKGHGEQRPLVPNLTEEQRAQNRRVEIRLKEGSREGFQESRISRTF